MIDYKAVMAELEIPEPRLVGATLLTWATRSQDVAEELARAGLVDMARKILNLAFAMLDANGIMFRIQTGNDPADKPRYGINELVVMFGDGLQAAKRDGDKDAIAFISIVIIWLDTYAASVTPPTVH